MAGAGFEDRLWLKRWWALKGKEPNAPEEAIAGETSSWL